MSGELAASFRSASSFCQMVRGVAEKGQLADALEMITNFVIDVISRESSFGTVFSSPELDRLCIDLGRPSRMMSLTVPDQDQAVILVTALSPAGGHSRVVLDIMRADPGKKTTILASNTNAEMQQWDLDWWLQDQEAEIEVAPPGNLANRLAWMQGRLIALRPARTYILAHHFDPICIAAAQLEIAGQLFYYHNCDHTLALGVHIPHATHVDFNGKCLHHCREVKGVRNNVFWPLVASVPRHRADRPFLERGHLTTCTSGGIEKFDNSRLLERHPYLYTYAEIVPLIIRQTMGTHIHIGYLYASILETIATRLEELGIPRERFIYVSQVPNLSQAFLRYKADLYVGSFPLGGGRAVVEAMGAGMPMILHSNYRSVFFSDIGEAYPGVMAWRTPDELLAKISQIRLLDLTEHSQRARTHFEEHHAPERLRAALLDTLAGRPPTAPPKPVYYPDLLQAWLDSRPMPTVAAMSGAGDAEDNPPASPLLEAPEPEAAKPLEYSPALDGSGVLEEELPMLFISSDQAVANVRTKELAWVLLQRIRLKASHLLRRR